MQQADLEPHCGAGIRDISGKFSTIGNILISNGGFLICGENTNILSQ
jgi:hypothetical protein